MKSPIVTAFLDCLTFLGTSLLRAIDAFWAAVDRITGPSRRSASPFTAENAQQQPLPGFPNFAPMPVAAAQSAESEIVAAK